MNDREYEAACITAAGYANKFEGEHKLRQYDEMISSMEQRITQLKQAREEVRAKYELE